MNYQEWLVSIESKIDPATMKQLFGEDVPVADMGNLLAFCLYKLSKLEPVHEVPANEAIIDVEPIQEQDENNA